MNRHNGTSQSRGAAQPGTQHLRRQYGGCYARILVVGDDRIRQMAILDSLSILGQHADIASHGLEAVTAACDVRYDLVLVDLRMPAMAGLEDTRQILAASAELDVRQPCIIALATEDMPDVRKKCLDVGMSACLTKPLKLRELADALERWLPQAGGNIELA